MGVSGLGPSVAAAAWRLLAPLLLMCVIWWLSDQPDLSTGWGTWDYVLRKCAHMTEYALLLALWWRALGWDALGGRAPLVAFALTAAWASLDEWHQTWVTGRHGTPVDVAIDAAGMLTAWLVLHRGRPDVRGRLVSRGGT